MADDHLLVGETAIIDCTNCAVGASTSHAVGCAHGTDTLVGEHGVVAVNT